MPNNLKIKVDFENNKDEVQKAFNQQVFTALKAIGMTAEGYAKDDCPVDTGRLRNSITFATQTFSGVATYSDNNGETFFDGKAKAVPKDFDVYIGSNVEYAPFVEYMDRAHTTGKAHFLRDAAATHGDEYKAILKAALED